MAGITDRRPLLDVVFGIRQGTHPAIADVAVKITIVEQFENEGGIDNGQFAQFQALGEDHDMGSFGRESVQDCSRPASLARPGGYFRPREPRPRYTAHPMEQAGERP